MITRASIMLDGLASLNRGSVPYSNNGPGFTLASKENPGEGFHVIWPVIVSLVPANHGRVCLRGLPCAAVYLPKLVSATAQES